MQYLIGEIGLLVLGAGFIGLLVGWLISRFFKSRSAAIGQRRLVDDIHQRDHEISRLQSDLRYASNDRAKAKYDNHGGPEEHSSQSASGRREPANRKSGYSVAAKDMRSDSASLTVRGGASGSYQSSRRSAAPASGQKGLASRSDGAKRSSAQDQSRRRPSSPSGNDQSIRSDAGRTTSKENELRAAVDTERHEKVQAFVSAGAREGDLKKRLDEETYSKIQAFAKLGESERTIAHTSFLATQSSTQVSVTKDRSDTVLGDYQKLMDQKNQQVDQLQQRVRDLLALKQQAAPAPAPVRVPVEDGAAKERERVLKANLEEESFAKVQAIAALGEAEQKLKLSQTKPSVDPSIAPLRRRAEQQDAIILDLRKRIEIQQSQSNVMQQEFDRKVRGREADLATLKADFSGGKSEASQAEIDSYRRKLSEAERTHQSRIAEFNTTLEARNREYDELGNRLEDLRGKIKLKDTQLGQLKTELETQSLEKNTLEASSNKYREELGGLKIALEEKDSNIVSLKSRATELERSGIDVREMETQLSEFTKSTEASAQKFENVILEQRRKLEAREQEIAALKSSSVKREASLEEQLVTIRNAAKDSESKKESLLADTNRYRSQKNAHEAEITQLGKDIRAATAANEHSRSEIKRLEVLAKEAEVLRKTLKDKQAEEQRLQQLVDAAGKAKAAAEVSNKKLLEAKDNEINKMSSDLSAVRKSVENEKIEVMRFKKEAGAEKSNIVQLTTKFEEESKKQQEKIASLEPLRLKLHDSELAGEKLRKEHQAALAKSSHDVELVRAEIAKLEKSGTEELGAKDKELADLRGKTKELHTLRSDLSQRDSKIATLDADLEKLRKQKGEYDNEIARLSKEVDVSKNQASILQQSLEAEKQTLATKSNELLKVQGSVKEHEARVATLTAETKAARDGDKKAVADLQGKLDAAHKTQQQEIASRDTQLGDLKHKLQALDTLRDENAKHAADLKALNLKLADESKAAELSRQEVSQLKKAADEARIASAKEKEALNAELRKAKEYAVQVETMRKQSDTYQSQIQGLKLEAQEKSTKYQQQIKELEPWQQKFKQADQQARDHQASFVKLKADSSADLEQKLNLVKQQNQELLTQRDKRIADLDQKVQTLDTLRQEIAQRDKKLGDLNTDIAQARKQASEFESRFKSAEQQAKKQEESLSTLKADYSSKGSQHATDAEHAKKEIAALKSQQQSLESKHAAALKENNGSIERLKLQISEGEKKVAESNKKLADAKTSWELEGANIKKTHESKLAAVQNDYQGQLDTQRSKSEKSNGELQSLQSKVSQLEPLQGKLSAAEMETKRLQEASKATSDKHAAEIAAVQRKVKELEPLQAKLASQEAEHRKLLDQQKATAEKHASEVAKLNNRVKEIEPLQLKLTTQEAENNRLQESRKVAVEKSAAELGALQARVQEIEPLQRKLSAKETELNQVQDSQRGSTEKATAEISGLLARVTELEPLQQKLLAKDAEYKKLSLEHGATADKSTAEITALKARVQQLEPLQQKLSSQEVEYKKLQEAQKAAAEKASGEMSTLQGRIRDLEPLQQKLSAKDAEYKKLSQEHGATAEKSTAEITALKARVQQLEPLQQKLSSQEAEYKKLQETQKAATDKASSEIASMQGRVRELEPLQQKLSAQAAEYKKLQEEHKNGSDKAASEVTALQQKLFSHQSESNKLLETQKAAVDQSSGEMASLKERVRELEPLQQKLSAQEAEYRKLSQEHGAVTDKSSTEINTLKARLKELEPLQQKLASRDAENQKLQEAQKVVTAKASSELSALQARLKELEPLKQKVDSQEAEYRKLQESQKAAADKAAAEISALKAASQEVNSLQKKLAEQQSSYSSLQASHTQSEGKYSAELSTLKARASQVDALERKLEAQEAEYKKLQAAQNAANQRSKAEVAQAPKPASKKAAITADGKKTTRKDGMDDLKLIFGIGPKIETMLNDEGVKHFEDIANWKQADIERYSEMLVGFPDRIERDEWVLSAQQLIDGTYNWEEKRKAREATTTTAKKAEPAKAETASAAKASPATGSSGRAARTADGKKISRKDGMDDLKLIFGIGHKIEKMLNRKGVKTFEDIAAWNQADIDRYSEMLEGFPDRIERDEWVQSAKEIIAGTYNWELRKQARSTKK